MGAKDYQKKKQQRPGQRRALPILAAVAAIVLIVVALEFYLTQGVPSNTVYCGAFEYVEFPAKSVVAGKTININETVTTAVSYTTSTSVTGVVGHTYKNVTNTVDSSGFPIGAETICRYISNTSFSSSSSSQR